MRLFIQEAAEQDILRQVEHYAEKGLPEIAQRFSAGVVTSLARLIERPAVGSSRSIANPKLLGLRTWPVKGFENFRIYYLLQAEELVVVRVLHSKQNTEEILCRQGL